MPDWYIANSFQIISPDKTFIVASKESTEKSTILKILADAMKDYKLVNKFSFNSMIIEMGRDAGAPYCMNFSCSSKTFTLFNKRSFCKTCGLVYCFPCFEQWKKLFPGFNDRNMCIRCFRNTSQMNFNRFYSVVKLNDVMYDNLDESKSNK